MHIFQISRPLAFIFLQARMTQKAYGIVSRRVWMVAISDRQVLGQTVWV